MAASDTTTDFQANIRKVNKLIEGIEIAMLTTVDESGALHSRPMYTQQAEFDGEVWFFLYDDSPKARDIQREPRVNLAYSKSDGQTYLSVAGQADIVHDRAKMEELHNPAVDAWFPQGLETPGIALLRVRAESAEYWDSPSSSVVQAIAFVKARVTGETPDVGDNEVLQLSNR